MGKPTEEERYERTVLDNSPERVINTTLQLLNGVKDREHREELRGINLEDWETLKPIVVRLWNEERNRIFQARLDAAKAHMTEKADASSP